MGNSAYCFSLAGRLWPKIIFAIFTSVTPKMFTSLASFKISAPADFMSSRSCFMTASASSTLEIISFPNNLFMAAGATGWPVKAIFRMACLVKGTCPAVLVSVARASQKVRPRLLLWQLARANISDSARKNAEAPPQYLECIYVHLKCNHVENSLLEMHMKHNVCCLEAACQT